MADKKLSDAIEQEAIEIVRNEKRLWEQATCFVTDRISFRMRPLIRTLRKNYFGIFDSPVDPQTGLTKVWYPLTEINVEAVVKNIDLDSKDINFVAKNENGYGFTDLTRHGVKDSLSEINFGEKLDALERDVAIDGTAVWKTYEETIKGKKQIQIRRVDLLNVYIDPTTPSIQEAYRFTERALMFPEEIKRMDWMNTDGIGENVTPGLPRTDPLLNNTAGNITSNVKEVDVYETWGKVPKYLITGNKKDKEEVEAHIVVSGIDSPGKERLHVLELNTNKDKEGNYVKPYEEAWYTRVPNRWYGRGIAEKLLTLQIYANIVFNVRINRSRISQLGLFKIKKGAGVTPQMLSRLPSNGAVVLNNLDDMQELVMSEVGMSSYKDEEVINQLAERLTNAFEVVTGERLPSSTTATQTAIQNTNAKSGFTLIKDSLGNFLKRWMNNHYLPKWAETITTGDIVRISANDDRFNHLVDRVTNVLVAKALDDHYAKGYVPSPDEVMLETMRVKERLSSGDFFVKMAQKVVAEHLDTDILITNEEMDVGVTISNIINLLSIAPEYKQQLVEQAVDLMGLSMPRLPQAMGNPLLAPQMAAQVGGAVAGGQPAPQGIQALGGSPAPQINALAR